ncbi:MAG: DUF4382 domain-containing protein [Bacteroidales bacterium]|nr:DUF4382 domain-containing protein [Bacteroidales bacterium]
MKLKTLSILLVAITFIFGSCDVKKNETTGTGILHVQITDAPFPTDLVEEANVTISKVEARQRIEETDTTPATASFITLSEEEFSFNLLELTNGVTEDIANAEVPSGTYDLVRLHITSASVLLKDGRTFDLKIPSGSSSGLKIFIKPAIVVAGGLSADLLLDFDVSRSFVAQGSLSKPEKIHGFIFKPVIKASNKSYTGSIKGVVTDTVSVGIDGAQVSIFAADTLNTTTFTDTIGNYMVLGLEAGTYKVTVDAGGYVSKSVDNVAVIAANATILDFELKEEL